MDVAAIRRKHMGTIGPLMNPELAEREYVRRRITPPEPKNFMKENARQVRRIERDVKRRAEEANRPKKAPFKMSRFDNVESKIAEHIESLHVSQPLPHATEFLRKGEKTGPPTKPPPREHFDRSKIPISVPAANDLAKLAPRKQRNYIRANASEVIEGRVRSAHSRSTGRTPSPELAKTHAMGEVPEYLVQRKAQWREEERLRKEAEPDPDAPPGMVLMPNSERLETLELLKKNHAELIRQLQSMPMLTDTLGLRQRRAALEKKLDEIEQAIEVFARPKVFINPRH